MKTTISIISCITFNEKLLLLLMSFSQLYTPVLRASDPQRDTILETLLPQVENPSKLDTIKNKIKGKNVLLDNPESRRLSNRKRKAQANRPLLKEDNTRGEITYSVFIITTCRYEATLPLHNLWCAYIHDLFVNTHGANLELALLRADYHGSILNVTRSRCPSLIGKTGVVLQETLNCFIMVTRENRTISTCSSPIIIS